MSFALFHIKQNLWPFIIMQRMINWMDGVSTPWSCSMCSCQPYQARNPVKIMNSTFCSAKTNTILCPFKLHGDSQVASNNRAQSTQEVFIRSHAVLLLADDSQFQKHAAIRMFAVFSGCWRGGGLRGWLQWGCQTKKKQVYWMKMCRMQHTIQIIL